MLNEWSDRIPDPPKPPRSFWRSYRGGVVFVVSMVIVLFLVGLG